MKNKTTLRRLANLETNGSNVFILDSIDNSTILNMNPIGTIRDNIKVRDKKYTLASVILENDKETLVLLSKDSPILKAVIAYRNNNKVSSDFFKVIVSNEEITVREETYLERDSSVRIRLNKELEDFLYGEPEAVLACRPAPSEGREVGPELQKIFNNINSKISKLPLDSVNKETFTEEEITKMSNFLADKLPPVLFKGDKSTIEVLKEFLKTYKID